MSITQEALRQHTGIPRRAFSRFKVFEDNAIIGFAEESNDIEEESLVLEGTAFNNEEDDMNAMEALNDAFFEEIIREDEVKETKRKSSSVQHYFHVPCRFSKV